MTRWDRKVAAQLIEITALPVWAEYLHAWWWTCSPTRISNQYKPDQALKAHRGGGAAMPRR